MCIFSLIGISCFDFRTFHYFGFDSVSINFVEKLTKKFVELRMFSFDELVQRFPKAKMDQLLCVMKKIKPKIKFPETQIKKCRDLEFSLHWSYLSHPKIY